MHATTSIIGADHAQQFARNESGNEPTGGRVRASEFCCDLCNVARAAIGEEIERGDLRQREIGRRELLCGGEDELTPKPANGDDTATDLAEVLTTTGHLIEFTTEAAPRSGGEPAAQLLSGTRQVGETASLRCMHIRIYYPTRSD